MNILPNSLQARDIAYALHSFSNLAEHKEHGPLVITRGEGIRIFDDSGTEYIDGGAGLWSVSLGYGEKRLIDAATIQMEKLAYYHQFRSMAHDVGIELAERLIKLLPVKMSKVFFNTSGSEANDSVTKIVWYYNNAIGRPRKKKFVSLINGYHGVTVAAASLTGIQRNHLEFDLPLPHVRHADCPHFYRYGRPGESEEEFATRLAENLDALIRRENPDTVAAFIAEPVQGAGGVIVPPLAYFEKIQPVLKQHDVLFVADEVICGFGRTGNMFGSETFSIKPDLMTMAKALSSSYLPISAVAIPEYIYEALVDQSRKLGLFSHGFTHSAHPVCAAVALETLNIYEDRDVVGHVQVIAPRFLDGLRALADHPLVGEVRGVGLVAGVELVADKAKRLPFAAAKKAGTLVMDSALSRGLVVRAIGDTLCFSPPLIITDAEVDDMVDRFAAALDDALVALHAEGA